MRLGDVDVEYDVVLVVGKGGRERALPFSNRTGEAIDQYLRARARHAYADLEWFLIGRKGRVTASGIAQFLRRRGRGSRDREPARPPSSPHRRPSLAQPGRRRNRPHAVVGLDVSGDAATLRRLGRGRARPRGPSGPFASRPAVADEGSPVERGRQSGEVDAPLVEGVPGAGPLARLGRSGHAGAPTGMPMRGRRRCARGRTGHSRGRCRPCP
jgi:hypothetical protein